MKKYLSLCVVSVIVILLCFSSSCRKAAPAPTDCFAALPDTVYVAQSVTFESCTKGATSHLWNFGDGSSATTDSATHTYTAAGVYHGSLTTSNGQSSTKTFTIIVVANPAGYFTFGSTTFFPDSSFANGGYQIIAKIPTDSVTPEFLNIAFNPTLPTTSGIYSTAFGYLYEVGSGQVSVDLYYHNLGIIYSASSGQKISITVLPNSKLNLVGAGIEMKNLGSPSDSLTISFNITQTQ